MSVDSGGAQKQTCLWLTPVDAHPALFCIHQMNLLVAVAVPWWLHHENCCGCYFFRWHHYKQFWLLLHVSL